MADNLETAWAWFMTMTEEQEWRLVTPIRTKVDPGDVHNPYDPIGNYGYEQRIAFRNPNDEKLDLYAENIVVVGRSTRFDFGKTHGKIGFTEQLYNRAKNTNGWLFAYLPSYGDGFIWWWMDDVEVVDRKQYTHSHEFPAHKGQSYVKWLNSPQVRETMRRTG